MDGISFQSTIRPVSKAQFNKIVMPYGAHRYVDYPWTIRESVLSDKAYTKHVFDCTVCGITDGMKVLMMHICPTRKENKNFQKITDFIKSNFNLRNPDLQAFLLGSKPNMRDKRSEQIFNNFEAFLEENKIPYSKLKGGPHVNDVAYSSETDEWIIGHDLAGNESLKKSLKNPRNFFKKYFSEVQISELDDTSW